MNNQTIETLKKIAAKCTLGLPLTEHDGTHGAYVKLRWVCPKCGAPRGEVKSGRSYDGSRILFCDTWQNPCGHVDSYDDVRAEAAANGLNGDVLSGGGK